MKSQGSKSVEWLLALPIHHFLQGYVQPFGDINFQSFLMMELKKYYGDVRKATDKHSDSNSDTG